MKNYHTELPCPRCEKTIKQYTICKCGMMYVVDSGRDNHVIYRKYFGSYLMNWDSENGECYLINTHHHNAILKVEKVAYTIQPKELDRARTNALIQAR